MNPESRTSQNLGLDLVRATEAAALVAGRWMGKGDADEGERISAQAMQRALSLIEFDGRVLFSGIEALDALGPLHPGEQVGTGEGPRMDLVVDPIEGRDLMANGHPDAIAVAAAAPRDAFWTVPGAVYMEKIVVGAEVGQALVPECLDAPAAWTLALVARELGKAVSDLIVFLLSRERHRDLIAEIRAAGARVMFRSEGDIVGALKAILPSGGVDVMMGIGKYPEGLITACAVKAGSGEMLGRVAPQSEGERDALLAQGVDLQRVLTVDELVSGEQTTFAATGITDGALLSGIHYHGSRATSNSLIMRGATHTRRLIRAEHSLIDTHALRSQDG
jgi:fructose-1,6-bisphosphatase II